LDSFLIILNDSRLFIIIAKPPVCHFTWFNHGNCLQIGYCFYRCLWEPQYLGLGWSVLLGTKFSKCSDQIWLNLHF